ncbi:MAG: hypothetical protein A3G93_04155 [Nitrospinae bacterium RIFCSPLOWO2_12_FULL_45_22]|nr:MAG: hypothetical protein A3G93_04155 [Nitrospinae bacterium RIFCSPLOWO2_12_FULL_45_22]
MMHNEELLISNLNHYYQLSLAVLKEFGGPSIYFHIQSIKEQRNNFLSDRHIEMIYATLASWGMHRMGDPEDTKAKMVEFDDFKRAIISHKESCERFLEKRWDNLNQNEYKDILSKLIDVYFGLRVSISESTIVAHSKTLAHIIPNLIPPIDRQYTVRFFTQENQDFFTNSGNYRLVNLPPEKDKQFNLFMQICLKMKNIFDKCDKNLFKIDDNSFNTSYPKIIDNLIMAFVKEFKKPKKRKR